MKIRHNLENYKYKRLLMTTIKDVARVANVSVATVSRVINDGPKVGDKTRQKVKEIMNELGYRPNANARALVTNTNLTIGVIIPDVADPFFAALAHGVDKISRQNKIQLLISTSSVSKESEKNAIELLRQQQCRCIVFHSKKLSNQELSAYCEALPNLVLINRFIADYASRCVWVDNKEGGKIAARHLLSLNHKNIAYINSNYDIEDPKLRLAGFSEELELNGLHMLPELIVNCEPNYEGGEEAAQRLISSGKRFTSLFAYNDAMAIGAISTLEDNGYRVPRDVSVVGFDDVLFAKYARPKLTTLCYPIVAMAEEAAKLSLSLSNNKEHSTKPLKFLPLLIRRESAINC